MGYFIFIALLAIATIAVVVGLGLAETDATEGDHYGRGATEEFKARGWQAATVGAAIVAFLLVTVLFTTDTVDNGHVGLKKQFGAYAPGATDDGLVTHAPWQSIVQVSVQDEKRTYKMGSQGIDTGNVKVDVTGGSAVSRDSQAISLFVQVNYSLGKECVVPLYKSTGGHFLERILDNAVFQHAKSNTASYAATEFAANREKVRQSIEDDLAREVKGRCINVQNVSLLDVGYSPGLSAAIEKTVEAKQRAVAAEAQVAVSEAEAKQKIATANGSAQSLLIDARATSLAQKLRQKTLTPELIQQQAIEKLNPNVSVIVCAAGKVCIPQAVIATANAGK